MSLAQTLLITGTDTEVGKTVITSALTAYWQTYRNQERLAVLKPVQAGPGDRELYQHLFHLDQSAAQINPLHYKQPLAPPLAADREGQEVDLAIAWHTFWTLQQTRDWVFVEGVGGLGCPLTWELTIADLAHDWRLPAILVVPVKLGAIGQTVANVALARQSKVLLRGLILNCVDPAGANRIEDLAPPALIQNLTRIPILGIMPHVSNPQDLSQLAQAAAQWDLESLTGRH